jgi:CubicO group peptidase (beta-lactamase class C family)
LSCPGRHLLLAATALVLLALSGCGPSTEELRAVDYEPLAGDGWEVSTPAQEGLDPDLVARLYHDAAGLEKIYSLLVVSNGQLIAEDYFNLGRIDQQALIQSVAKSYTSALVGIALEQGCLPSVEARMVDYVPDLAKDDPRKGQITIRDMLQMRAGYPAEEGDEALFEALFSGDYVHLVADVPLASSPGSEFQYSNLTAHWLGVIVARACDTDLESLAQTQLFDPLGAQVGPWRKDVDGYNWAAGELHVTARDAARFGLLYLDDGEFHGSRVISSDWVDASLATYSEGAYGNIGAFGDIGYGYLWWSADVGGHPVNFAWGHGGQLIVLVDDLDMVVVVTSDPFYDVYGSESWQHEKANFELVGAFISSLPAG